MKKPLNEGQLLEMLKMEKLVLEAHELLGNDWGCLMTQHRIADIRILLLVMSGDLPVESLKVVTPLNR
jgi:hypothetical protein